MPILSFQKNLIPKVLDGSKPFTLRHPRKDRRDPRPGQTLYMATGTRTSDYKLHATKTCEWRYEIKMLYGWLAIDSPDSMMLVIPDHLEIFARLDGFDDYEAFCKFHGLYDGCTFEHRMMIGWQPWQTAMAEILNWKP